MKKLMNYIYEPVKKNKKIIIFNLIIFVIGLIFGSLFINFINSDDKKILVNEVGDFILNIKKLDNSVFGIVYFKNEIINNIFLLFLIYILGLSLIGILIVIFIMFFKGFTVGITVGIFIYNYSLKGIILSFIYIFPCLILNILIYIFVSSYAVYISLKFIKALINKNSINFKLFVGRYTLSFIISIILLVICTAIDSYLTPILLKLFTLFI